MGRSEDAIEIAWECFYGELGRNPELPEAVFQTEQDFNEFHFYPVRDRDHETGRARFSETFINYLRCVPCQRMVEHKRPVTLEDGFTETEVASGNNFIVRHTRESWPEAQARADEIVAAWDAWNADVRRRRDASGRTAADEAHDQAMEAYQEARTALMLAPARTMRGAIAKAAIVMGLYEDSEEDFEDEMRDENTTFNFQLSLSLARDLRALAGEA